MRWKEPLTALFSSALLGACSFLVTFETVPGGSGGSSSSGGSGGTMAGSGGTMCTAACCSAADCPAPKDPCKRATCTASVCSEDARPDGSAIATQSTGDCKQAVCVGGSIASINDNGDTLDDGNDCTTDSCQSGKPVSMPVGAGTACSSGGGKVCDDLGLCVACLKDADCPVDAPKCDNKSCVPASCGDKVKNGAETDTDCGGPQCSPCSDGNDCIIDKDCVSQVCGGNQKCSAPTCNDKIKNGTEGDVDCGKDCPNQCGPSDGCTTDADCTGGVCTGMNGTCVPNCQDGVKNNAETDVDCGGGGCGACENGFDCAGVDSNCKSGYCDANGICATKILDPIGSLCANAGTCASGNCIDGVCCDQACQGTCRACSKLKTGAPDGTCTNIPAGSDPDLDCAGGKVCDGNGSCKSGNGFNCGNNAECLSGVCVDGVCCATSCSGTCKSCDIAGTVGTCVNVPAGTDPNNECMGNCNGLGMCGP